MGNLFSRKQNSALNTSVVQQQQTESPKVFVNYNGKISDGNSWKFVAQSVDLNGSVCNGSVSHEKYATPQARIENLMNDSKSSSILPIDHDSSELMCPIKSALNQSQVSNEIEMMKQLEEKLLCAAINDTDDTQQQQSMYNIPTAESVQQPCTPVNSLCQVNPFLNNEIKQRTEEDFQASQVTETKAPLAAQEDHSFSFQHDTTADEQLEVEERDVQFEQEIVSESNQVEDFQTHENDDEDNDDDNLDDYPVIELQPTTITETNIVHVPASASTPTNVESIESNQEALDTIQALDDVLNAQQSTTESEETNLVQFRFEYPNPEGIELSGCKLAGSFNNWSEYLDLKFDQVTRKWFMDMRLEPGMYEYKFILNGKDWKCDYTKPTRNDNNFIELTRGC